MNSVKKLKVYQLVETPKNRKHIDPKWGFKVKEVQDGTVTKF